MEQVDIEQPQKKKTGINVKAIVILGIILAAVSIAAVVIVFSSSEATVLSGKYYSTYNGPADINDYMEFSGKNTIEFYEHGILMGQGTYKLTNDDTVIEITYGAEGLEDTFNLTGSVNSNKSIININGESYLKK